MIHNRKVQAVRTLGNCTILWKVPSWTIPVWRLDIPERLERNKMSQLRPLKRVGLRVRDLETTLAYYHQLGLATVRDERAESVVGLGTGGVELLTLRHTPDARPRAAHTAGLYHFALL